MRGCWREIFNDKMECQTYSKREKKDKECGREGTLKGRNRGRNRGDIKKKNEENKRQICESQTPESVKFTSGRKEVKLRMSCPPVCCPLCCAC